MTISETLLPEFDNEMANTRKTLERVPEDKFAWKPHPKSFALGPLANHLATLVGWTTDTIGKDSFDLAPPGGQNYRPSQPANRVELLSVFDEGVAKARAALAGASDDHLMQPWSLLNGGQVLMTMPRIVVIRNFVLNHMIHHRAQLGVYLRLNEIPVPSIYGPSADENPFA
jgi:uncharacterized damage-inducible protein DinB